MSNNGKINKQNVIIFVLAFVIITSWSYIAFNQNSGLSISSSFTESKQVTNSVNKTEVFNYAQSEKDCSDKAKQIEKSENERLGNTFPNTDDHNKYVVYVTNHFNRRDNKCMYILKTTKELLIKKVLILEEVTMRMNFGTLKC